MGLMGNLGIPACNSSDTGIAAIKKYSVNFLCRATAYDSWVVALHKKIAECTTVHTFNITSINGNNCMIS